MKCEKYIKGENGLCKFYIGSEYMKYSCKNKCSENGTKEKDYLKEASDTLKENLEIYTNLVDLKEGKKSNRTHKIITFAKIKY